MGAVALAVSSAAAGAMTTASYDVAECRGCDSGLSGTRPGIDFRGSAFERAAARTIPSMVTLNADPNHPSTIGSGIVLTADGLILTSGHVVSDAVRRLNSASPRTLSAAFADGRTAPLTIVGTDPDTDVAVVRAEGVSGCSPVALGSSATLIVGQTVVAIGSPFGLENSVTRGIVSALHRPMPVAVDSNGRITVLDTIQTDADTSFGSSGGALVDSSGAVIAMNSLFSIRGVGFALPIDQVMRIANELIGSGTASHAFLGVRAISEDAVSGAKVLGALDNGPATMAGISPGTVIIGIDDRRVANAEALVAAVMSKAPGDTVAVRYITPAGDRRTSQIVLTSDRDRSMSAMSDGPSGTSELGHGTLGPRPTWSV